MGHSQEDVVCVDQPVPEGSTLRASPGVHAGGRPDQLPGRGGQVLDGHTAGHLP